MYDCTPDSRPNTIKSSKVQPGVKEGEIIKVSREHQMLTLIGATTEIIGARPESMDFQYWI